MIISKLIFAIHVIIFLIIQTIQCIKVCPRFIDYFTHKTNENCYENPEIHATKPADIIKRWNYTFNEFKLTTLDGYKISIYRIYGEIREETPLILGPGIYMNSFAFIDRGNKSLAFFLANQGFDVWIINWRGNKFSRDHIFYDSDENSAYWKTGFHEMAVYDLKSVTKFIHGSTGKKSIYIGFSMGTTIGLIFNIKEVKTAEATIKNIIHLAPISSLDNMKSILKNLNPIWPIIRPMVVRMWKGEVLPTKNKNKRKRNTNMILVMKNLCWPYPFQMVLCELMLKPIFGTNFKQMDPLTYPITSQLNQDSISTGTIDHYSQIIRSREFREYNHGLVKNIFKYGRFTPPLYNLQKLTIPQTMFVGTEDIMATLKDTKVLYDLLPEKSKCGYVKLDGFTHRDFIISKDIIELFFAKLLHKIREIDQGIC